MIFEQLKKQKHFTELECSIADYILKYPDCILNLNAKELGGQLYASSSTIVRFCKKLGYSGYPEFQQSYIREYSSKEHYSEKVIFSNFTFNQTTEVMENLYHYVIRETSYRLDQETLRRIISLMYRAKKIDFYGNDSNFFLIEKMTHQLNNMHVAAQAFNYLNTSYYSELQPDSCIAFLISHSGTNENIISVARKMKIKGITTIAITSSMEKGLSSICDYTLFTFAEQEGNRIGSLQWTISVEYLFDLLYVGLISYSRKFYIRNWEKSQAGSKIQNA